MTRYDSVAQGEVFVFGSNGSGAHGGGAALQAYEQFGAVWGQAEGLQGQSYGIDSMSGLAVLEEQARRFVAFAAEHPELRFLVTEIGCGIAGYVPEQVAPFFRAAGENVVLPERFAAVLDRTLRTQRLVLRPWTTAPDDVDFLFGMHSRWDVQQYLGAAPRLMESRDEALAMVRRHPSIDDGVRGIWAVTEDGRRLGTVLLKHIPWSADTDEAKRAAPEDTEIGWHLHPDAWGHGYATEAASALLARAFAGGIPRVVAVTYPQNLASQRVCERLGMSRLGPTTMYYGTTCELFSISRAQEA